MAVYPAPPAVYPSAPPPPAVLPPSPANYDQPLFEHPAPNTTPTVVVRQPATTAPRAFGSCPYCGGETREEYTAFGILLCIIIPIFGLIFCLVSKEKRCIRCKR